MFQNLKFESESQSSGSSVSKSDNQEKIIDVQIPRGRKSMPDQNYFNFANNDSSIENVIHSPSYKSPSTKRANFGKMQSKSNINFKDLINAINTDQGKPQLEERKMFTQRRGSVVASISLLENIPLGNAINIQCPSYPFKSTIKDIKKIMGK